MASLEPPSGMALTSTEFVYTQDTIEAVGFSSVSWSWSLSEVSPTPSNTEGKNIIITPQGMSLILEYVSEEDLFPLISVEYLFNQDSTTREKVDDFADIPSDSSDIVRMEEDRKSWCDWILTVTATGTDTSSNPATATGTYDIRIYSNYDISRDKLKSEVNKRYASSN